MIIELFTILMPNFIVYIYILLRNVIYDYKGSSKKTIKINNYKNKYLIIYFLIYIVNFKYTVDWIRLINNYFKIEKSK